ncbi:hypothetical protein FRC00_001732, partial [Tulasnella sp. 408]
MQASAGLPRSPYDYQASTQFQSKPQTHKTAHQPPPVSQGSPNAASPYSQSAAAGTGAGYWTQERSSEDDAYGGMDEYGEVDDYADSYMDDYYNEPSPPAPVPSTRGGSTGYASSSSLPSKPSKSSPYQPYRDPAQPSSTSPPTSPLQPPQLRHPSLSPSYRSSAASSYSTTSSSSKGQLGADLAHSHSDQRSTWRSDITNADAFAFRDYESPAPPRVVITAPMTPPTKRMSEVQEERWEEAREDRYAKQEEEEIDMTVSPLRIRERELEQQPAAQEVEDEDDSMMHSSPSGRSRSMYNAANFSRPIRSGSPEDTYSSAPAVSPPNVEPSTLRNRPSPDHGYADFRPESIASVYSTASTMPPLSVRRSRADSASQPLSILRTSAAYAESNRVLPPISPTSEKGSGPPEQPPTSQPPQPAQVVNRKPSIRFQDPRPPPPVPPPLPPSASSIQPSGTLQRSASTSGTAGAAPHQQAMQRSNSVNPSTTSPNRAQIIEQARNRAPPPPPGQYNDSHSWNGPGGSQALDPSSNMGNSNSRSRSPGGDSVYSNYSYYDPEQVRGSAPSSPLPNAQPQPAAHASKGSSPLAKGPSASPRSKSKHKGSDNGPSSEPRTAEDYLQLGIQHHLDGDLVESAYCFEISAKGIGALRQANSQSMARSSQSTSDHSHSHPGQNNDAAKYALG